MKMRLNTGVLVGLFGGIARLCAVALKWGYSIYFTSQQFAGGGTLSVYGSDGWQDGVIGVAFLLMLLYLIATGPLHPPPVWRPVSPMIFALIAAVAFLFYGYGPGRTWSNFAGPWISILSILAVLITATIELRGAYAVAADASTLSRRRGAPQSCS